MVFNPRSSDVRSPDDTTLFLMPTLHDTTPDDRAQAIIIAGNTSSLQHIEELIMDGHTEEAVKCINSLIECNFAAILSLAAKCGTNPATSMAEALELLEKP